MGHTKYNSYLEIMRIVFLDDVEAEMMISIKLNDISNPTKNHLYDPEGFIEIKSMYTGNKNKVYWDNISFFILNSEDEIREECVQDLIQVNFYQKDIFKIIKEEINEFIRQGYL